MSRPSGPALARSKTELSRGSRPNSSRVDRVESSVSDSRTPRMVGGVSLPGGVSLSGGVGSGSVAAGMSGGGSVKKKGKNDPEADPEELIQEFDAKLGEINAMLNRYKSELAAADEASRHKAYDFLGEQLAAQLAAGQRRRGQDKNVSEEEAYMNAKIHRRVKSAGPGASRTLSERIDHLRNNAGARHELQERVKTYLKERKEAHNRKVLGGAVNFIEANIRTFSATPEPPAFYTTLTGGPPGLGGPGGPSVTASPMASRMVQGSRGACRPATAPAFAARHLSMTERRGGGGSGSGTTGAYHPWGSARKAPAPAAYPSGQGAGRTLSPAERFTAGAGEEAAAACSHAHPHHSLPRPHHSPPLQHPSPHPCAPAAGGGGGSSSGGGSPPRNQSQTFLTQMGLGIGTRPVSVSGTAAMGSLTSAAAPGASLLRDLSPEDRRNLRLTYTGRPASGGSPTRREEFLADHRALHADKRVREREVRERHVEIVAATLSHNLEVFQRKEARKEEERRRREEEEALRELQDRQRRWLGTVSLCHKLWFLRQALREDRKARPLRMVRKQAAVTIATWYKHILLRRRQREVVELIRRLRRILAPFIPAQRERVRQICAARVVHFLRNCQQTNLATVAVRRFKQAVAFIQEQWRVAVMVRNTQRMVLYNWLLKFEKTLIRANTRGHGLPGSPTGGALKSALKKHANMLKGDAAPRAKGAARPAGRGRDPLAKGIEIEDPELDAELATLKELLPQEVRLKLVDEALFEERRKFAKVLDQYRADKKVFQAQKPIEEIRVRLLKEAGLNADVNLEPPPKPSMSVLLPRGRLKQLIRQGMQVLEQQRMEAEEARREQEEMEMLLGIRPATNPGMGPGLHSKAGGAMMTMMAQGKPGRAGMGMAGGPRMTAHANMAMRGGPGPGAPPHRLSAGPPPLLPPESPPDSPSLYTPPRSPSPNMGGLRGL